MSQQLSGWIEPWEAYMVFEAWGSDLLIVTRTHGSHYTEHSHTWVSKVWLAYMAAYIAAVFTKESALN